jgi:hypothetical protein
VNVKKQRQKQKAINGKKLNIYNMHKATKVELQKTLL